MFLKNVFFRDADKESHEIRKDERKYEQEHVLAYDGFPGCLHKCCQFMICCKFAATENIKKLIESA